LEQCTALRVFENVDTRIERIGIEISKQYSEWITYDQKNGLEWYKYYNDNTLFYNYMGHIQNDYGGWEQYRNDPRAFAQRIINDMPSRLEEDTNIVIQKSMNHCENGTHYPFGEQSEFMAGHDGYYRNKDNKFVFPVTFNHIQNFHRNSSLNEGHYSIKELGIRHGTIFWDLKKIIIDNGTEPVLNTSYRIGDYASDEELINVFDVANRNGFSYTLQFGHKLNPDIDIDKYCENFQNEKEDDIVDQKFDYDIDHPCVDTVIIPIIEEASRRIPVNITQSRIPVIFSNEANYRFSNTEHSLKLLRKFLEDRFGDISTFNTHHGSSVTSFEDINFYHGQLWWNTRIEIEAEWSVNDVEAHLREYTTNPCKTQSASYPLEIFEPRIEPQYNSYCTTYELDSSYHRRFVTGQEFKIHRVNVFNKKIHDAFIRGNPKLKPMTKSNPPTSYDAPIGTGNERVQNGKDLPIIGFSGSHVSDHYDATLLYSNNNLDYTFEHGSGNFGMFKSNTECQSTGIRDDLALSKGGRFCVRNTCFDVGPVDDHGTNCAKTKITYENHIHTLYQCDCKWIIAQPGFTYYIQLYSYYFPHMGLIAHIPAGANPTKPTENIEGHLLQDSYRKLRKRYNEEYGFIRNTLWYDVYTGVSAHTQYTWSRSLSGIVFPSDSGGTYIYDSRKYQKNSYEGWGFNPLATYEYLSTSIEIEHYGDKISHISKSSPQITILYSKKSHISQTLYSKSLHEVYQYIIFSRFKISFKSLEYVDSWIHDLNKSTQIIVSPIINYISDSELSTLTNWVIGGGKLVAFYRDEFKDNLFAFDEFGRKRTNLFSSTNVEYKRIRRTNENFYEHCPNSDCINCPRNSEGTDTPTCVLKDFNCDDGVRIFDDVFYKDFNSENPKFCFRNYDKLGNYEKIVNLEGPIGPMEGNVLMDEFKSNIILHKYESKSFIENEDVQTNLYDLEHNIIINTGLNSPIRCVNSINQTLFGVICKYSEKENNIDLLIINMLNRSVDLHILVSDMYVVNSNRFSTFPYLRLNIYDVYLFEFTPSLPIATSVI
jgi:hypothetical protein